LAGDRPRCRRRISELLEKPEIVADGSVLDQLAVGNAAEMHLPVRELSARRWEDDVTIAVAHHERTCLSPMHGHTGDVAVGVVHEQLLGEAELAVRRAEPRHSRRETPWAAPGGGRRFVDRLVVDEFVVDVLADVSDVAGLDGLIAASDQITHVPLR